MRATCPHRDIEASTLVVGVGGAGGNAVSRLFGRTTHELKVICANTDRRALRPIPAHHRLLLGPSVTRGQGAGANPTLGSAATREVLPEIIEAFERVNLCFVVAGVGRGTGGGGAPVIAETARNHGILTIGIVIKPFLFEGRLRASAAESAIREMEKSADAIVVVSNENMLGAMDPDTTFRRSLEVCDEVVGDCILDLATIVDGAALKRVSLADVRSVLTARGRTVIGHGKYCCGAGRAVRAAASALSNPLLDDVADGARRMLLTISGGPDLGLFELEEAVEHVRAAIHPDAQLVWGSKIHPALKGAVRVGIAAAGLPLSTIGAPDGDPSPSPRARASAWVPVETSAAPAAEQLEALGQRSAVCLPSPIGTTDADGPLALTAPEQPRHRAAPGKARIYSRHKHCPSLLDRIYFATRSLRRRLRLRRPWIDRIAKSSARSEGGVRTAPIRSAYRVDVTVGRLFAGSAAA